MDTGTAVTIYGVCVLTFMMVMYAREAHGRIYTLLFGVGCALSSVYGFASGAWPFGVVELIWAGVAFQRYRVAGRATDRATDRAPGPQPGYSEG